MGYHSCSASNPFLVRLALGLYWDSLGISAEEEQKEYKKRIIF